MQCNIHECCVRSLGRANGLKRAGKGKRHGQEVRRDAETRARKCRSVDDAGRRVLQACRRSRQRSPTIRRNPSKRAPRHLNSYSAPSRLRRRWRSSRLTSRTPTEDLVAQSTKIGALYTDLGKETYITFERLVGRFGFNCTSAENFRSKGAPRCVRRSRQRNRDDELTALEFHLGPSGRRPQPSASACRSIMITISEDQW